MRIFAFIFYVVIYVLPVLVFHTSGLLFGVLEEAKCQVLAKTSSPGAP